jgi:hypothetical protein
MTTERSEKSAARLRQLTSNMAFRRWSNLSLAKDVLIAVALLVGLGAVLSVGSSGLDLVALRQ